MTKEKLPKRLDGPGSGAGIEEVLYGPEAAKRRKREEAKKKRSKSKK